SVSARFAAARSMTQSLIAFAAVHVASLVIILVFTALETTRSRGRSGCQSQAAAEAGIALDAAPVMRGGHAPQLLIALDGGAAALSLPAARAGGRSPPTRKRVPSNARDSQRGPRASRGNGLLVRRL